MDVPCTIAADDECTSDPAPPEDEPPLSPPLHIELTPLEDLLTLPYHLFRRPLVLEGTGL